MPARRTFLDAGGRSPVTPRTAQALAAGLVDGWADPARLTTESRQARTILDSARGAIAEVLAVPQDNVYFAHSVPMACERIVRGMYAARRGRDRMVMSAIEREALTDVAEFIAPGAVDRIDVDGSGHLDVAAFAHALSDPRVAIAAVQHANREIGTIQRLDRIYDVANAAGVPLIVDATASIGHVDAPEHWDALIADPSDWGAPAGLAIVAVRPQTRWLEAWPAGDDPWAPGGVSVPVALAAAVALQERVENMERESQRQFDLVTRLRAGFAQLEGVHVVGDEVERLPHLLTAAFLYLDGEPLVTRLDREGFAVGSGSACGKAQFQPSQVLAAMGALTHGNLRIGLHPGITDGEIERFLATMPRVIEVVRQSMTS
ncbi:aminotransferase class V-fold PLP-dependent enzyme [Demequina sp. B12]|uniref:cysteine desulfurase family protein n=1 Tax=Demequina sp. B12 TaxID=2992757 RepID=UPI00237A0F46|nr:aminotransferase class V-fold PLP-dependent enzyme [Demequina sp. B12]MDE0572952.1 aminotransferase class V-fold PLP-dependent enzyme [Demequina sp. B12]